MKAVPVFITAKASLNIKLAFAKYENVTPEFGSEMTVRFELDEGEEFSIDEARNVLNDLHKKLREDIEAEIDHDIFDVKEVKLFDVIGERGQRVYPENKKVLKG